MIHGFRGAPLGLSAIAEELRQYDYDVHTPPMPPFAGTAPLHAYTPEAYANYLKDYIIEHQLTEPILIGHSMGSVIATATATYHSDIVNNRLILLAPISAKPSRFFATISPLCSILPNRVVDYITTRYLYIPQPDRKSFRKIMQITSTCSSTQTPSRKDVFRAARFSTKYCISDFNLQKDIAIIVGQQDRLIRPKKTTKLAQNLNAKTTFIPKSGHLHNYEKPQETAKAILEILQNL